MAKISNFKDPCGTAVRFLEMQSARNLLKRRVQAMDDMGMEIVSDLSDSDEL